MKGLVLLSIIFKSVRTFVIQIPSSTAKSRATISASPLDFVTEDCFFVVHDTGHEKTLNTKPLVDLPSVGSLAHEASTCPTIGGEIS